MFIVIALAAFLLDPINMAFAALPGVIARTWRGAAIGGACAGAVWSIFPLIGQRANTVTMIFVGFIGCLFGSLVIHGLKRGIQNLFLSRPT